MIAKEALLAIPRRLKRPLMLALILGMTAIGVLNAFLSQWFLRKLPHSSPQLLFPITVGYVALLVTGSLYFFLITPLPWQWTGDGRRMATPLRGILQSLGLNLSNIAIRLVWAWPTVHNLLRISFSNRQELMNLSGMIMAMGFGVLMDTAVGYAIATWETRQAEQEEALRRADEARWNLLKGQMSPHVLLNSLNGLAELVREDAAAATQGMKDLAEVYRQLLTMGEAPRLPLSEERRLLERYLAVEQLRLGEQLRVEWLWEDGVDEFQSIPLLLQPLVENAIKHGAAADTAGGMIRIQAAREGRFLHLSVANTGTARSTSEKSGTGVGLRNLKARLELAYHGQATFQLVREKPWTRAELCLPLEETS